MRQTCIFSGSSHPQLVEAICARLGSQPSQVELKKFSNGETSVEISKSIEHRHLQVGRHRADRLARDLGP